MSWRRQASPRRSSIPLRRKTSCWSAATPRRRTIFIAASPGRDFKRRFQLALSVPSPSNNSPQGDAATGASFGHHSKCIGRRCNHVRPDQLLPCHCRRGPFAHHHLRAVSDSECCAGADEPALSRGLPIQKIRGISTAPPRPGCVERFRGSASVAPVGCAGVPGHWPSGLPRRGRAADQPVIASATRGVCPDYMSGFRSRPTSPTGWPTRQCRWFGWCRITTRPCPQRCHVPIVDRPFDRAALAAAIEDAETCGVRRRCYPTPPLQAAWPRILLPL